MTEIVKNTKNEFNLVYEDYTLQRLQTVLNECGIES